MSSMQRSLFEDDGLGTRPPPAAGHEPGSYRRVRGPMTGWRAWRLVEREDGPVLLSTAFPTQWHGPVLTADRQPDVRLHGIYAFDSRAGLDARFSLSADAVVVGQVTLFGRVAIHELGYRAERCRIDRLWLAPCGAHPVIPCACTGPPGAPLILVILRGCRHTHEAWLDGKQYRGRGFDAAVRHAYCRCRLAQPHRLTDERLGHLADALAARYQCDVSVLPVGGRGLAPCWYLRPVRQEQRLAPRPSKLRHGGSDG